IEPIAKKRAEAGKIKADQVKTSRPDYQSSGDDNIILQGIHGSKTSFGWVGFAYAEGTEGQVKELKISKEPAGTCVEPSVETISTGTYPLSRYLYLYVNAAKAKENAAIGAFIDYYLGDGIAAVSEVKYVPLASTDLEATKTIWCARTSGTRDGGK
ncbi:MAG: PstS family phosphate ABC transporter substrate-binding protein, partial [Acidimicrobiia bacterium]